MNATITRQEWRRVALFIALVLLVVSLPYALAWSQQDKAQVFSGFLFGVDDGNSYIAKMRLGAQGRWDFSLVYTSEDHDSAALVFLPYILPGQIVGRVVPADDPALTGTLIGVFHLMRIAFGALMLAVIYRFIAAFVALPWLRMLALLLATLGGGLGLLVLFSGALPPEFYIPEGFSLQILLGLPHLALARSALLGGLLLLMNPRRSAFWAGLCWLVVGLAVPFYLALIYCVLGAWGLVAWIRQRQFPWSLFRRAIVAAGITLPLFIYFALVFSQNPAFAQWSAQNILTSPPLLDNLLAYLPLALLAILGARQIWRSAEPHRALLIGWPLIVPLLIYLPINVQRRLAEAVIVPLAILAVFGIERLTQRWNQRLVIVLTLFLTLPTSLLLIAGAYNTALNSTAQTVYSASQIAALDWLNQEAEPGAVVLSSFETGNLIPAYSNLRAYLGHGPETLNSEHKRQEVQRYFGRAMNSEEWISLLTGVNYILYGPNEARFNPQPDFPEPQTGGMAGVIYHDQDYLILRVIEQR